jgi:glycosyltransferase involved in cell wall biosynthesis
MAEKFEVIQWKLSRGFARRKRVAVIVPILYRGGSLRGAKLMAQAIFQGSQQCNEAVDVVFLYPVDKKKSFDVDFSDLYPGIQFRPFYWKTLGHDQALRAMLYAGHDCWEPKAKEYIVAEDGINNLYDCDLWLIISDRLDKPILPLRPRVHMVYDYLQRYVNLFADTVKPFNQILLDVARRADRILVTTDFTRQDVLQFVGISSEKVVKVPMLAPDFSGFSGQRPDGMPNYFLWPSNPALHKNHDNAVKALLKYYEELDGKLDCIVTGANMDDFLNNNFPHLTGVVSMVKKSKALLRRVHWQGELSDSEYQQTLTGAAFLWHAGKIDNGTFCVIEAATLGVPALSSDYPPMREIDKQFSLNLAWMDAYDPADMATQLKQMELSWRSRQDLLPSKSKLAEQGVEELAADYWKAIRECL